MDANGAGARSDEVGSGGAESGHLVIVVPADLAADGTVDLDLTAGPIFFGEPALPEQVDESIVQKELSRAMASGLGGPTAAQVASVMQEPVRLPALGELHAYAANLIETYSPMEVDLIRGLRAPRIAR